MQINLNHILVPTDFSEVSEGAVNYAFELAEQFGARVTLMHVSHEPLILPPTDEGYIPPMPDLKALEDDARSRLDAVAVLAKKRGIEASTAWSHGAPFVEIIRLARELKVDLIVAGTHGRGPIAHLLLGSVAENIVRQAPCPVLTVRQGEQKFEMP